MFANIILRGKNIKIKFDKQEHSTNISKLANQNIINYKLL